MQMRVTASVGVSAVRTCAHRDACRSDDAIIIDHTDRVSMIHRLLGQKKNIEYRLQSIIACRSQRSLSFDINYKRCWNIVSDNNRFKLSTFVEIEPEPFKIMDFYRCNFCIAYRSQPTIIRR